MSAFSSSTVKWTYDVFLSFRGDDTRTNSFDHLYTALDDRSIYTFKDDDNLKRGKSISPELIKAIQESRFAILVFSSNCADSSWFMNELVKIIDCKNLIGQTLLPVFFYDVDPSEVRKQTWCFEKAFAIHEINGKEDEIQRWRNALGEAASTSGWALPNTGNWHESQHLKQIVGYILTSLGYGTTSSVADNSIRIESLLQNVKSLLLIGSDEVRILGWGMGGVGKTTIARAVFDIVANVKEVSKSSRKNTFCDPNGKRPLSYAALMKESSR